MEYKLMRKPLKGFILTRTPEEITDELIITFTGAPEGAMAIFENENKKSLYRQLENNTCSVPVDFLQGNINVVATVFIDGATVKYRCEEIYVIRTENKVVVCPNGINMDIEIIGIYEALDSVHKSLSEQSEHQRQLEDKLTQLIEGYDIT